MVQSSRVITIGAWVSTLSSAFAVAASAQNVNTLTRSNPCPVAVMVKQTKTGCEARVDNAWASVTGKGVCTWNLVTDDVPYTFAPGGIRWAPDPDIPGDTEEKANERANKHFDIPADPHLPSNPGDALRLKVRRMGRAKGNDAHYYLPVVRRVSDDLLCDSLDPRIAND